MKIREYTVIFLSALLLLTACGESGQPAGLVDLMESIPEMIPIERSRLVKEEMEDVSKDNEPEADAGTAFEAPEEAQNDVVLTDSFLEKAISVSEKEEQGVVSGSAEDQCVVYSDEQIAEVKEQQNGYYFGQLQENEKTIYAQLLKSMQEFESDVEVSTLDAEEIERVFQCVMNDHPEIFYIQGFTYTKYTLGNELKKIAFSGTYTMDKQERDKRISQIGQYVATAVSGITGDMDDYEKIKNIYQYIVEKTEYDSHSIDNQNICSVFLNGRSVCQGYAKAMQYLLNEVGVDATLVLGTVSGGQGHAWNLVKSDGEYYYVDVTWGDASYRALSDDNSMTQYRPSINYDYLCVTTEQICRTHQISSPVKLPVCVAVKDNYYRREDALFSQIDEAQLSQLFAKGYESERPYVTLKCTDRAAYDAMYDYLITEQHIFEFLAGAGHSVNYTNDENQWSMSFWL